MPNKFTPFKGTPGPWLKEVRETRSGNSIIVVVIPNKKHVVLETVLHIGLISSDDCRVPTCCKIEEHANANLIAAAPDLLDALMECQQQLTLLKHFAGETHTHIVNGITGTLEKTDLALSKALTL